YGSEVASALREIATAPESDRCITPEDWPGLEQRLGRVDPKLLATYAREKGAPQALPVIDKCVERLGGKTPLKGFNAVMVQHMLGTQLQLLDALEKAGLDPRNCMLMGRGS